MCEVAAASWIPTVVSETLTDDRSARPVLDWLTDIRASIEEYDPLITVRPPTPEHERGESPDSAFDEILSRLGKEIYNLDEFHHNLLPTKPDVSLSILNIFDECLDGIGDGLKNRCIKENAEQDIQETKEKMVTNGCEIEFSDSESNLSDVSIISCPEKDFTVPQYDVESVFVNDTVPIPAPRARLKKVSSSSSLYDSINDLTVDEVIKTERLKSESDSVSTCWSYQEINKELDNQKTYAVVWSHSSGFHNSDAILKSVLLQHHATISQLSFDEASEFTPAQYSVYTLGEVGDRCAGDEPSVRDMTPDRPIDDSYEPVRDAITTDENIYEEIEYGYSYTDEGCSCSGSAEVECFSISASSSYVGRDSDSPLYVNLRDHDAYSIPPDVIYWKNLLLDPYYNDDEEDEWITPEECAVYSREQRPPLIIPRITQYRPPTNRHNNNVYFDSEPSRNAIHGRQYERLHNSPKLSRSYSKTESESPLGTLSKRLGVSTELLHQIDEHHRRQNNLNIPASSSGDSLDIEIRKKEPGQTRPRESRSMMALPKARSPKPTPRKNLMNNQTIESLVVVHQGPVKRTQFTQSARKSKKNWTDCYMVLTPTAIYFFKDQKAFYNSLQRGGPPPSPACARADLVLPLRNAHVIACIQTHTRRYSRSIMLSINYDSYLIQDETEEGAKRWLRTIQGIIFKLGPYHMDDMPQSASSTDHDSLGRTPPTSRHNTKNKQKAGGSSNEDLSDTTEVSIQKSHVRSRLRKFFAKRPAMDVLIKKGIYKDEPVFGRDLEVVCPAASPRVPEFVVECIRVIESTEENMKTDGLYRASGNLSQVQKIRLEVDQNNFSVLESCNDIHVLTGSLKLFFRELKEPVIPKSMFDRVLAACSLKPRDARVKEFRDVIHSLPQCNQETLKYLLEHLLRVTKHSEHNRMHIANLAIVFGPTLLNAPAHRIAIDCIQQNNVVDVLLSDYKEIFEDDVKGKKKA